MSELSMAQKAMVGLRSAVEWQLTASLEETREPSITSRAGVARISLRAAMNIAENEVAAALDMKPLIDELQRRCSESKKVQRDYSCGEETAYTESIYLIERFMAGKFPETKEVKS